MPISAITQGTDSSIDTTKRQKSDTAGFSKVLDITVTEAEGIKPGKLIQLGSISRETPTVSHILKNHPEYSNRCWDIIRSSENQGKQFTRMSEGTLVALKPETNELVWGKELSLAANSTAREETAAEKSINIGTITRDNPTVSHLFQVNSGFENNFWNIIHASVNNNKEYRSLQPGTQVELNPATLELSFKNNASLKSTVETVKTIRPEQVPHREGPHQNSLADAVKPFIGKSYKNIDCYGLVVRGLINQGVKYHGHGGLREKLEDLAELHGLPGNAYLNGEGLVEKAGEKLFSKSLNRISNTQKDTDEIYNEMKPYLQEGQILSFSTPTRGHTGVISRQGNDWTYINSGLIDNQVSPGKVNERVGEEFLKAEIKNWFALASSRKESLRVTLGQVHKSQAQNFVMSGERSGFPGSKI